MRLKAIQVQLSQYDTRLPQLPPHDGTTTDYKLLDTHPISIIYFRNCCAHCFSLYILLAGETKWIKILDHHVIMQNPQFEEESRSYFTVNLTDFPSYPLERRVSHIRVIAFQSLNIWKSPSVEVKFCFKEVENEQPHLHTPLTHEAPVISDTVDEQIDPVQSFQFPSANHSDALWAFISTSQNLQRFRVLQGKIPIPQKPSPKIP